jgi:hypothetical protein
VSILSRTKPIYHKLTVGSYYYDRATSSTRVSEHSTVTILSDGTIIAPNRNPSYEQRFVPPNAQPYVSVSAPTYYPVPGAVGSPVHAPIQIPFYSAAHGAVVYAPVNTHAYAPVNAAVPVQIGAPFNSTVHAAVHFPVNAPVRTPIHTPARPRSMTPVQSPSRAPVHTSAKPRSMSRQNGSNSPRISSAENTVAKKRGIRWLPQLEIGETDINSGSVSKSQRPILQQPRSHYPGGTPAFQLEFTFEGQKHMILFMSRIVSGNLLRLFEEQIVSTVEPGQMPTIRNALNNGYSLEYGYWGKTLVRPIRGSSVLVDPEASFHAFLNGVRQDSLVKIV